MNWILGFLVFFFLATSVALGWRYFSLRRRLVSIPAPFAMPLMMDWR